MKRNLVPLASVNNISGFPVKCSTLRKWKHIQKYPELFCSLGRKIFVDLDVLEKLIR